MSNKQNFIWLYFANNLKTVQRCIVTVLLILFRHGVMSLIEALPN